MMIKMNGVWRLHHPVKIKPGLHYIIHSYGQFAGGLWNFNEMTKERADLSTINSTDYLLLEDK